MPNWTPNWEDVKWDFDAASAAVTSLKKAADALGQIFEKRNHISNMAREEWRGRKREEYDYRFNQQQFIARRKRNELLNKASEIQAASNKVLEEQKRREVERDRWRLEKIAETNIIT